MVGDDVEVRVVEECVSRETLDRVRKWPAAGSAVAEPGPAKSGNLELGSRVHQSSTRAGRHNQRWLIRTTKEHRALSTPNSLNARRWRHRIPSRARQLTSCSQIEAVSCASGLFELYMRHSPGGDVGDHVGQNEEGLTMPINYPNAAL